MSQAIPAPRGVRNSATRGVASTVGVLAGLLGVEHPHFFHGIKWFLIPACARFNVEYTCSRSTFREVVMVEYSFRGRCTTHRRGRVVAQER